MPNAYRRTIYRRTIIHLVVLLSVLTVPVLRSLPARADDGTTGRVLVKLQSGASIDDVERDYASREQSSIAPSGIYSLQAPAGVSDDAFAARLAGDPRILLVEKEGQVGFPEVRGKQMHLAFDAGPRAGGYVNQIAYKQVDLGSAHRFARGTGVVVAILDTGINRNHPDLRGHCLAGANMIDPSAPPIDAPDRRSPTQSPATGHGTMLAGIIAKLAPDARILPVKVLNADGIGAMIDVIRGVRYAIAQGATVINMSFGTTQRSELLNKALEAAEEAGVVLVASAGNDGTRTVQYPAACEETIAVASVDADNQKSDFSNYGRFVHVAAPGRGIRSTYWTGGYATWSGTSFSTAFVSAAAALVLSVRHCEAETATSRIQRTARSLDSLNPLIKGLLGHGLLDIEASVRLVEH